MLRTEKIMTPALDVYTEGRAMGVLLGEKKNINELLNHRCPGLIQAVREVIETSEFQYRGGSIKESFLWQHTVYVASMAMRLSYQENVDPLFPVVTALFHDCGKFKNGKYHEGKKPEEEASAEIAQRLLRKAGFSPQEAEQVGESLLALHNENKTGDMNTCIVNDADFLIKFGHMGFANFFEKSVLRGMVIRNSILKAMSKELTYAASLETHIFTRSGKEMARKKSRISISLFRNYLEELRTTCISDYEIRKMANKWGKSRNTFIPLILVLPRFCELCWNPLTIGFDREIGIKQKRRLIVNITCPVCSQNSGYNFSFCLPTVGSR